MSTIATSFTSVTAGIALAVKHNDLFTYAVSGTFVGTVILERSNTQGAAWEAVLTATAPTSGTVEVTSSVSSSEVRFRFRCSAFTSGTIVTSLVDGAKILELVQDLDGNIVLQVKEDSVTVKQLILTGTAGTRASNSLWLSSTTLSLTGGVGGIRFEASDGTAAFTMDNTNVYTTFNRSMCTARANVASAATIASLASTTSFVKLTGSTATDLQGIAAGIDGQILRIWNATGQILTIRNASASAASGAKITTTTGADVLTVGNGFAEFIYDTDASPAVWVCSFVSP